MVIFDTKAGQWGMLIFFLITLLVEFLQLHPSVQHGVTTVEAMLLRKWECYMPVLN